MKVINNEKVYTINEIVFKLKDKIVHQHDIEIIESLINKAQKYDVEDQPHFRNFRHFSNICKKYNINIDNYIKVLNGNK